MKTARTAPQRARNRKPPILAGCGVAAILLLASAVLWLTTPRGPQQAGIGGPFRLVADGGRVVTDRSFPGKYLAIYFGYTECQDVCPATLNNLSAALAHLGRRAERIQPLFVTIDPSRDSPDVLHRFVENFSPNLVGLTGTDAALDEVRREFHVARVLHRPPARSIDYVVDHSSVIYLMAPDGAFVAPIPADASDIVMAQAIARNLDE